MERNVLLTSPNPCPALIKYTSKIQSKKIQLICLVSTKPMVGDFLDCCLFIVKPLVSNPSAQPQLSPQGTGADTDTLISFHPKVSHQTCI